MGDKASPPGESHVPGGELMPCMHHNIVSCTIQETAASNGCLGPGLQPETLDVGCSSPLPVAYAGSWTGPSLSTSGA